MIDFRVISLEANISINQKFAEIIHLYRRIQYLNMQTLIKKFYMHEMVLISSVN